jgi:hypothetical protein
MGPFGAFLFFLVGAFFAYFVPAIIAQRRHVADQGGIVILNLLLGWTVIGWLAALGWALAGEEHGAERTKSCPSCGELAFPSANVCPHCHRDMPGVEPPAPAR